MKQLLCLLTGKLKLFKPLCSIILISSFHLHTYRTWRNTQLVFDAIAILFSSVTRNYACLHRLLVAAEPIFKLNRFLVEYSVKPLRAFELHPASNGNMLRDDMEMLMLAGGQHCLSCSDATQYAYTKTGPEYVLY